MGRTEEGREGGREGDGGGRGKEGMREGEVNEGGREGFSQVLSNNNILFHICFFYTILITGS